MRVRTGGGWTEIRCKINRVETVPTNSELMRNWGINKFSVKNEQLLSEISLAMWPLQSRVDGNDIQLSMRLKA